MPPAAAPHPVWQTSRFDLSLAQPRVMAIVNVTPDSFSDGGRFAEPAKALARCEQALREGAHLLDLGAESSRPGAPALPLEDEWQRLLPVLRAALTLGVPVSVDTYKPEVMRAALDLGADVINDIWGLRQPGALQAVAQHPRCGVCVMHMHGEPGSMQDAPLTGGRVDGAVQTVADFLHERVQRLREQGVADARIALDPGIGFGKTVAQNFALLAQQSRLLALGHPLLVGWSRKSSLGKVTGLVDPLERVHASVAAALLCVERGARIVRVHDVAPTVEALAVWSAVQSET